VQLAGFTINSDLLLTELTYLLASIPLPLYNFVLFTSILFIYALTTLVSISVSVSLSHGLINVNGPVSRRFWDTTNCWSKLL